MTPLAVATRALARLGQRGVLSAARTASVTHVG